MEISRLIQSLSTLPKLGIKSLSVVIIKDNREFCIRWPGFEFYVSYYLGNLKYIGISFAYLPCFPHVKHKTTKKNLK